MALYYDAVSILSPERHQGSLKSRIYGTTTTKSKPAQLYALISETAKRDNFLKEVLENAQLLKDEPKLTPLLATLICHDHFFSKSGIAANSKHPLKQSIERHKARLQSEFTRARLRRGCVSVDALKAVLDREKAGSTRLYPRWARVNTLIAEDAASVLKFLPACKERKGLVDILEFGAEAGYCHDEHVPKLLAFSTTIDIPRSDACKGGQLILQDKASCFPAYLLLGGQKKETIGDVMDGCAAPGNKTTHLAAIMHDIEATGNIFACERDSTRSKTLQSMVMKAQADQVEILARQDFLALKPGDPRFQNVTHLLLDPSCSGSGILGRQDIPKLAVPEDSRANTKPKTDSSAAVGLKKRKREENQEEAAAIEVEQVTADDEEATPIEATKERLRKLSILQAKIVEHAMSFPAARRITYSTCSIHEQENEVVVSRLLASKVARDRGWMLLLRSDQVEGMKRWKHRGVRSTTENHNEENRLGEGDLDACIRCSPDNDEGTMGFFVCGFVRTPAATTVDVGKDESNGEGNEDWEGFD